MKYLKIGPDQVSKEDKEILKRYMIGPKTLTRKEHYESGIYIQDMKTELDTVKMNMKIWNQHKM